MSYFVYLKNSLTLKLPEDQISPDRQYSKLRESLRHIYPSALKNWKKGTAAYGLLVISSLLTYPQPMINRYLIDDVILNKQIKLLAPGALIAVRHNRGIGSGMSVSVFLFHKIQSGNDSGYPAKSAEQSFFTA